MKKTCVIITGPTAVGKTSIAIELAEQFGTEIISADSRQCYKELNIGVAKPSVAQLEKVPHHFINSHSIREDVSAADFEQYALDTVSKIFQHNDIAIMVGGTGLYIRAFCEGLDPIPGVDTNTRNEIINCYTQYGLEWLREQLFKYDPVFSASGEMKNPQRMMRALEVKRSTGKSILEYQNRIKVKRDFDIIQIGLDLPREVLYAQINKRVDLMMESGLEAEAASLLNYRNLNALQTVGYKELFAHFDALISKQKAVDLIKQNSRNYAKRQLTWFRKDPVVIWTAPYINLVNEKLRGMLK